MGFKDPSLRDWRYRSPAYLTVTAPLSILAVDSVGGREPRSYSRATSCSAAVQSWVSREAKRRLAFSLPLPILVSLARYPRHQIGQSQVSAFCSFFRSEEHTSELQS